MPSSVTSAPPQLADLRLLSNPSSIQVNQEIFVISTIPSRGDSISRPGTYSSHPSATNAYGRQHSNSISEDLEGTTQVLSRFNSDPKISRSFVKSQIPRDLPGGQDNELSDSNRESMKALEHFLRTKEPPLNNWVSILPEEGKRSKVSIFKLFGRDNSKKLKGPGLLQLPDSAVSAQTRSGSRHIAISIPLEHYHIALPSSLEPLTLPRLCTQSKFPSERQDKGAVTILKPVVEVRESGPSPTSTPPKSRDGNIGIQVDIQDAATPVAEILGLEATRTVENYYPQESRHHKNSQVEADRPLKSALRSQQSYVAVSPASIARQDSVRTDPRHSGGTAYSTATISTQRNSRETSSISTATSLNISPRSMDPPAHNSSLSTKLPVSLQAGLAQASKLANERAREETRISAITSISSNTDASLASSMTASVVLGTAETAQGYNPATGGLQSLVYLPKSASLPPTKRLPDLPQRVSSRTSSPRRLKTATSLEQIGLTQPSHIKRNSGNATEAIVSTHQSRQDRVKARNQRDTALSRDNNPISNPPFDDEVAQENRNTTRDRASFTTPSRRTKRRSASNDVLRRKALNTVTPVMVIVSLPPITGHPLSSHTSPQDSSNVSRTKSAILTHTPPLSRNSSFIDSDSDTIPQHSSSHRKKRNSSKNTNSDLAGKSCRSLSQPKASNCVLAEQSHRLSTISNGRNCILVEPPTPRRPSLPRTTSTLETRRRERREKRNLKIKEREVELRERALEARLAKIERDNVLVLTTLTGIAKSFGDLSSLVPRASSHSMRRGRKEATGLLEVPSNGKDLMGETGRELERLGEGRNDSSLV